MSTGELQLDRQAPLFSLSYRRRSGTHRRVAVCTTRSAQGSSPERHVLRVFHDLSAHVSQLVGLTIGDDPGYVDMSPGPSCDSELLRAIGTCHVFVPLVSAPLVHGERCAVEWDLFSRRQVVRRADGRTDPASGIVPVLWAPLTSTVSAPGAPQIQWFVPGNLPDPDIATLYLREGLQGLLAAGRDHAYQAFVWRLAQRIVTVFRSFRVEPLPVTAPRRPMAFRRERR